MQTNLILKNNIRGPDLSVSYILRVHTMSAAFVPDEVRSNVPWSFRLDYVGIQLPWAICGIEVQMP